MARKGSARRKVGILCMVLGLALLGAALALLLYNQKENSDAGDAAVNILPKLQEEIDDSEKPDDTAGSLHEADSALEVDGNGYIGYLTIPALDLQLPVMSEWSYPNLKTAPCRYFGSIVTDDLVICGHNYTRHFGLLKNLQAGDEVLFTDIYDVTIPYQVIEIETLQPTEIERMIGSDYDLTLYTCTYGGASRVTVRCDRVEQTETTSQPR